MSVHLSNTEKVNFMSNLSTMLGAGIPILEAVESLLSEAKGNAKVVFTTLQADLNQGKSVGETLARFPDIFDPATINLVKSAEAAGNLETTLKDIVADLKKQIEFDEKVQAALTYPALVFVVFTGVILLMLTFVIPRIAAVFERLNVTLPLPTQILIFLSKLVLTYTIPLVALLIITVAVGILVYRSKRKVLVRFLFSLPLISHLGKEIDITRFARSMALLLKAGIPLTEALELSEKVVAQDHVARAIRRALKSVSAGKSLTEGFKASGKIFPSLMIRITEAGERSGTLEKSLQEIAEHSENQVSKTLRTLTVLLEPLILVVVGLLIGGMMLAIIAPIYGLIGNITTR